MYLVITPTYSDIFEGDLPELETLLSDIPSEVCLSILGLINAQLYYGRGLETQLGIVEFLTFRQTAQTQRVIIEKMLKRKSKEPSIEFFSLLYTTEFINYELINFRDSYITDTTPTQELNFLKAYLLIAQQLNDKYHSAYLANASLNADYFQKTVWPTLIDQFEVNHNINPITGMVKGIALLNYIQFRTPYSSHVEQFLKKHGKDKSWNYILDLIGIVKRSWEIKQEAPSKLYPFHLSPNESFQSFFETFSVSHQEYARRFKNGKQNFSGLKDKPLFKSGKANGYVILNWNFLSNKLYDGLLFDFYGNSGISEHFPTLIDFKKFVSKEIVERFLFRKLVKSCFNKKHSMVLFDDDLVQGFPDAYVRQGKYVYLFEIKDAFFPASSINSLSYAQIKETIDKKFNNDDKGTGQLEKQLVKLSTGSFERKSFEELKLKRRNVVIYPIIVYTDSLFNLPGVNQYLKQSFNNRIEKSGLRATFKSIQDLTFINLSFFIDNIHFLSNPKVGMGTLIETFQSTIRNAEKKLAATQSLENLFPPNDPFEEVVRRKFKEEMEENRDFVDTIVKVLNLTENLES